MRRQLALAALAISSMIVLAFVIPLALLVRTLAEDRALTNAEHRAQALVPVLATLPDEARVDEVLAGLNRDDRSPVSVVLADGRVRGAPATVDDAIELARRGRAFNSETPDGLEVLIPVVDGSNTSVVRVFVPNEVRREGVAPAWVLLTVLGLVLVGGATAIADRMGKTIVDPVTDLARTADRLGHGELTARVEPAGPPEIVEVGVTLNRLADRIGDLLDAERAAVGDLSHRLRTPMTALRLDIDALPAGDARDGLTADLDDLTRAVDSLIAEARRPVRVGVRAESDLAVVARERATFWSALAEDQGRACTVTIATGRHPVAVPHDDLVALLDALLGNVFAHTPDGTAFAVRVDGASSNGHAPPAGASLVVEDDGPGIDGGPDGKPGTADGPDVDGERPPGSTGLGLDIVARTAEASGGGLALSASPTGGFRAVVTFGPPPAG